MIGFSTTPQEAAVLAAGDESPISASLHPALASLSPGQSLSEIPGYASMIATANFSSSEGSIVSAVVTCVGVADASTPLMAGQVVGFSVLVTDTAGNSRSFSAGTLTLAGGVAADAHVFLLGGQSNGTDLGAWDGGADWPDGAFQLERWAEITHEDMPGSGAVPIAALAAQIIPASRPLHHHFRTRTGGFGWSLQFVIDYMAANPGTDVVLIPGNWGGSGFQTGQWGVGNPLHEDLIARAGAVLAANPGFQLKGLLWHQGESDVGNGSYQSQLDAAFTDMRARISGAANLPIALGEVSADWVGSDAGRLAIQAVITDAPNRLSHVAVVSSAGTSLQDTVHFDAASYRLMGSRYHAALAGLVSGPSAAAISLSGSQVSFADPLTVDAMTVSNF